MSRKMIGICCCIGLIAALAAPVFAQVPASPPPSGTQTSAPAATLIPSGPAVVICCGASTPSNTASETTSSAGKGWSAIIIAALWPAITLLLGLLILSSPSIMSALRQVAARITKVATPGGFEVDLSPQGAQQVRASIGDTLGDFTGKADLEYSRAVTLGRIWQRLGDVFWGALPEILEPRLGEQAARPECRITIHVPDIVFDQYLYQLTKYYRRTEAGIRVEGKPGGRYSMRFGIIGRVWRLQESVGVGNALPTSTAIAAGTAGRAAVRAADAQPQPARPRLDPATRELIKDWGMFKDEAEAGARGHPAYLCVILWNNGLPEGLLFIDSPIQNAFGNDATALDVAKTIEQDQRVLSLARALGDEMKRLRESGPFLVPSGTE